MSFMLRRKQAPPELARCVFRRAANVLVTKQGEEIVLLDTRGERYYTLNDVGAVAWNALTEPKTHAGIVEVIRRAFDTAVAPDPAVVERDVALLMEQLLAAGLVSVDPDSAERAP